MQKIIVYNKQEITPHLYSQSPIFFLFNLPDILVTYTNDLTTFSSSLNSSYDMVVLLLKANFSETLSETLKTVQKDAKIPIIAIFHHPSAEKIKAALLAGVQFVLVEPVDHSHVNKLLKSTLDSIRSTDSHHSTHTLDSNISRIHQTPIQIRFLTQNEKNYECQFVGISDSTVLIRSEKILNQGELLQLYSPWLQDSNDLGLFVKVGESTSEKTTRNRIYSCHILLKSDEALTKIANIIRTFGETTDYVAPRKIATTTPKEQKVQDLGKAIAALTILFLIGYAVFHWITPNEIRSQKTAGQSEVFEAIREEFGGESNKEKAKRRNSINDDSDHSTDSDH